MLIWENNDTEKIIKYFFNDIIDTLEETLENEESNNAFYEGFDPL